MSAKEKPVIAGLRSIKLDTEPGTYFWCACGKSAKQPFCDGSHKVTSITPVKYTAEETKTVYFCGCKHSSKSPLCDGTHKSL